jgi:hypothetical protein
MIHATSTCSFPVLMSLPLLLLGRAVHYGSGSLGLLALLFCVRLFNSPNVDFVDFLVIYNRCWVVLANDAVGLLLDVQWSFLYIICVEMRSICAQYCKFPRPTGQKDSVFQLTPRAMITGRGGELPMGRRCTYLAYPASHNVS